MTPMVKRRLFLALGLPLKLIAAPFAWIRDRIRRLARFFAEVPEDVPLTEAIGEAFESREALTATFAGLGEHIDALRRHLLRSVIALALTTAFSFAFAERLMLALAVPLGEGGPEQMLTLFRLTPDEALRLFTQLGTDGLSRTQVIEPTESVGVFMRVSLLSGVAFAMPWIVLELYLFIAPGLMPRSRLLLLLAIPAGSLLFIVGIAFTYFVLLPTAIPFLYNFMNFRAAWRPAAYFGFVTSLMFWIGMAFQMPLVVYALAAAGLVHARQLAAQWRLAVVVIAVIAAAITPTVDPVNMALVMLPMILLYGFSILGAAVAGAGRRRDLRRRAMKMEASP